MNFSQACAVLAQAARLGSRPGLESITRLCALLGNPQNKLKIVHVAGTNGKGSVCQMLACIGQASGYRTGLFSSPFIEDYRESISINGKSISKAGFARMVGEIRPFAGIMEKEGLPPTEYELLTACAFLWFARKDCGMVVLETCMGGRLDVTNVVEKPLACVIGAIGLDHTAYLGDTVLAIAAEKSGIIKPGSITAAYPLQPPGVLELLRDTALKTGCPFILPNANRIRITARSLRGTDFFYEESPFHTVLPGEHQVLNASLAIETARALNASSALRIPEDAVRMGLSLACLPARQEVFWTRPLVILDGAHNPQGIRALAATIQEHLQGRRIIVVMGMLADKSYEEPVGVMAALSCAFIATSPESPRALDAAITAQTASKTVREVYLLPRIADALDKAMSLSGEDGAVVVCGSLYLALPARRILKGKNKLHLRT